MLTGIIYGSTRILDPDPTGSGSAILLKIPLYCRWKEDPKIVYISLFSPPLEPLAPRYFWMKYIAEKDQSVRGIGSPIGRIFHWKWISQWLNSFLPSSCGGEGGGGAFRTNFKRSRLDMCWLLFFHPQCRGYFILPLATSAEILILNNRYATGTCCINKHQYASTGVRGAVFEIYCSHCPLIPILLLQILNLSVGTDE